MNRTRIVALLVAISATFCIASSASAYVTLRDSFGVSCDPAWSDSDLPNAFHINNGGYSGLGFNTIVSVMRDSFAEWGAPCCSRYTSTYAGTTTRTGEATSDNQNTISFIEDSWPGLLGNVNQTIAVTQPRIWDNCEMVSADMVFNGVGFTFSTSGNFNATDVQSIATHEAGHWIGLDHSPITSATMYYAYQGGTGARSLHSDDEQGVCFLYGGGTCGCSTDNDCNGTQECVGGNCVDPRCNNNSDCDAGQVCNTASGVCEQAPCSSDNQCPGNQVCRSGECATANNTSGCSICEACDTADDCGGSSYVCAGICTAACAGDDDCPGDSACLPVRDPQTNDVFNLCLNPNAGSVGICQNYSCNDNATSPCDGVTCPTGQSCNPSSGQCVGIAQPGDCEVCEPCSDNSSCTDGFCAEFTSGETVCTIQCDNGSCPGNSACIAVEDTDGNTLNICMNPSFANNEVCPSSYICTDAIEPPDPCENVNCPTGQTCNAVTGSCEGGGNGGPTTGPDCPVCFECATDADCGVGSFCASFGDGVPVCTVNCDNSDCPGDSACFSVGGGEQVCLNPDASTAGVCPAAYECSEVTDPGGDTGVDAGDGGFFGSGSCSAGGGGGSGALALLLGLGLLVRRRR